MAGIRDTHARLLGALRVNAEFRDFMASARKKAIEWGSQTEIVAYTGFPDVKLAHDVV